MDGPWHTHNRSDAPLVRGGPIFSTGFSILSAKGFLEPHPTTPKSFQRGNKNLSILNKKNAFHIN